MRFNNDPVIDKIIPKGVERKPIKLSKNFIGDSSEYSLDLIRVSEKVIHNRKRLEFAGLNFNFNCLFKSLVKKNKNI